MLHGHSMGGLIIGYGLTFLDLAQSADVDGIYFETPAFQVHPRTKTFCRTLAAKIVGNCCPKVKVGQLDFSHLSGNVDFCEKTKKDWKEIGDNGGTSAGFALHFMNIQDQGWSFEKIT